MRGTGGGSSSTSMSGSLNANEEYPAAYCAYSARCNNASEASCLDALGLFDVASDSTALTCAEQLRTATCGTELPECDITVIADPSFAYGICTRLARSICTNAADCGGGTPTECSYEMETQVCPNAVAFRSSLEACETEVRLAACPMTTPPPSCVSVVRIGGPKGLP